MGEWVPVLLFFQIGTNYQKIEKTRTCWRDGVMKSTTRQWAILTRNQPENIDTWGGYYLDKRLVLTYHEINYLNNQVTCEINNTDNQSSLCTKACQFPHATKIIQFVHPNQANFLPTQIHEPLVIIQDEKASFISNERIKPDNFPSHTYKLSRWQQWWLPHHFPQH